MTADEAKQLLPIITAFANGEIIQVKYPDGWIDIQRGESLSFENKLENYRIKPKEHWIVLYCPDLKRVLPTVFASLEEANKSIQENALVTYHLTAKAVKVDIQD